MALGKMTRTGFTLPEELLQRVKALKGRLNVSEICRAALRVAVENIERQDQADADLQEAIARLRATKNAGTNKDWLRGFKDGQSWAKDAASYDDLKERLRTYSNWNKDENTNYCEVKTLQNWGSFNERTTLDPRAAMEKADEKAAYNQGVIAGVFDFWDRVKDYVED